jgi:hypothetical protein
MGTRAAASLLRDLLYCVVVFIAAMVVGMIGALPVVSLGLFVPYVSWPLGLLVGALLAGIGASWAANLLTPDRSRSDLRAIAAMSAAIGIAVGIASMVITLQALFPNLFTALLFSMVVIAVGEVMPPGTTGGPPGMREEIL